MIDEMVLIKKKLEKNLYEEINSCEIEFIELIRHRLGIIIKQKHDLYQTISEACSKFQCEPKAYLQMLSTCPDHSPLLEHLIIGITIGETYFFRDNNQMKLLQEIVLPDLIKRKRSEGNLVLRIWSAGCSSGEEIYTLAMMLNELLPDIKKWNLSLLGTDINIKLLKKAINGRYTEWSMRSITDYYKNRYFKIQGTEYILDQKIKKLPTFQFLNLNDDVYPSIFNGTNAQDLIMCRNVLIYVDDAIIEQVMHKFSKSLMPNGYLMLGASDPINTTKTNFVFHSNKGILFSLNNENKVKLKTKNMVVQPVIKKDSPIIKSLPIIKDTKTLNTVLDVKKNRTIEYQDHITQLLEEAEWQQALDLISKYEMSIEKTSFFLDAKAKSLANLGRLKEAIDVFKQCLSIEPTNKYTYFMYALTLSELNEIDECEKALRKTLFLDHQFVPGHFQLGLLLIKNKQYEAGIKSLRNALMIAETKQPDLSIPGSSGLNYGRFAEILEKEINLYVEMER